MLDCITSLLLIRDYTENFKIMLHVLYNVADINPNTKSGRSSRNIKSRYGKQTLKDVVSIKVALRETRAAIKAPILTRADKTGI